MKRPRNIAQHSFALTLAMVGLMSWSTLPIHSSSQTAQAATNASLTKLTDQPASRTVANGKIAFVGFEGDDSGIYTMNPDGSDRVRLTFPQGEQVDGGPAWSPDGKQIAFDRFERTSKRGEIFVMDADGSNLESLTPSGESDYSPTWSPDGTQILFVRSTLEGKSRHNQVFAMSADGSNQRRLTHSVEVDDSPIWSPDGTKIAFLRSGSLVVMNADGSDQRIIGEPSPPVVWSPDNSKLAFASGTGSYLGIFVVNVDGSNLTPITNPPSDGSGYDASPSWSPDGSKITFTRLVDCNYELVGCGSEQIWVVNADGSNQTKLIDNGFSFDPSWSPDGTKIIFNGGGDLLVMNADGSGITNITNTNDNHEFSPSWQPLLLSCADSISPTDQSFDSNGGAGSIDVTAGSECTWMATSHTGWISVATVNDSGNGSVVYSVAANTSTSSRTGALVIAGRIFRITQAGLPVRITNALVDGKMLFITGENFDIGAVILLNGEEQITRNDGENPQTALIGKKAGKRVQPGDKLQVRNPNGSISQEFTFTSM